MNICSNTKKSLQELHHLTVNIIVKNKNKQQQKNPNHTPDSTIQIFICFSYGSFLLKPVLFNIEYAWMPSNVKLFYGLVLFLYKPDKCYYALFSYCTWETPALAWWAFFWSPQFPVASEYFKPSEIILVLIASSKLKSFPLSINFCAYILTSFSKFLNIL